jgi:hypothetical protein
MRCWRCCSSSRSGSVVALHVGAGFALEEASVSANLRSKDGVWGLRATSCARAAGSGCYLRCSSVAALLQLCRSDELCPCCRLRLLPSLQLCCSSVAATSCARAAGSVQGSEGAKCGRGGGQVSGRLRGHEEEAKCGRGGGQVSGRLRGHELPSFAARNKEGVQNASTCGQSVSGFLLLISASAHRQFVDTLRIFLRSPASP